MTLGDRRKYRRADLRYTIYVVKSTQEYSFECKTKNLCSGGFYCFSEVPLTPGERIRCTILFLNPGESQDAFALNCQVEILRVDRLGRGSTYGIAGRIDEYSVVTYREQLDILHCSDVT